MKEIHYEIRSLPVMYIYDIISKNIKKEVLSEVENDVGIEKISHDSILSIKAEVMKWNIVIKK